MSLQGKTRQERHTRELLNKLDGFGTFAPISVSFEAPLDVGNIVARHADNRDPSRKASLSSA